ncbi:NAD-dependent deacetylase [candidate division KSB1 bacterium]
MSGDSHNELVYYLKNSKRILIFTGAGISTGSGIPDYRGPQGVWKKRQPVYYQDFMASEPARIEYWDFKLEGWEAFRDAEPNAVHLAIAELERHNKIEMVVTQNIDGLHHKGGTSPEKLVEIHGTDSEIECQTCRKRSEPGPHYEYFKETNKPPVCECGGFLKPATISFGQNLKETDLQRAINSAGNSDLAIALGSTLSVYPAANITLIAAQKGAPYIVINRGETDHDSIPYLTLRLEGDVSEIFPPAVKEALG